MACCCISGVYSQDIAYARAQHGHTTFVRTSARSAEAFREVWGYPPQNLGILQRPRVVPRSYVAKRKLLTTDSRKRLVILWIYIAILRRSISRPFRARLVTLLSVAMSNLYDFTLCSIKIFMQKLIMKMSLLVDHQKA